MIQRFFLGANSEQGFYSLYGGFPPYSDVFLHIIKGGPGTGKSSFMRLIGQTAEERGQDVRYVLCSGDPDSLDGVYIPELKLAWVDGTAPHTREPGCFNVDSDYVNLGSFCHGPIRGADARRIRELEQDNKQHYSAAYRYLNMAGALQTEDKPLSPVTDAQLREILEPALTTEPAPEPPCFLHAISCQGELWLTDELCALCPRLIRVSDAALRRAQAYGGIVCLSPLHPQRCEALLFPQAGLALVNRAWPVKVELDLSLCAPPSPEALWQEQTRQALLNRAVTHLRRAKAAHDALEAIYQRYMDYPALNAFTQEQLDAVFS